MRSCRSNASIGWRRRRSSGGSDLPSIAAGEFRFAARGRDDIAYEIEYAVGFRRPVRRPAEPDDHQPFGWHDDHVLPDGPLGENGVARPAVLGPVGRTKTVAEIGPEAGADAHPGIRCGRG